METKTVHCACHSNEHQVTFRKFDTDDEIYMSVHLTSGMNFFERLVIGIKYIFGHKSEAGNWDEFIIDGRNRENFLEIFKED